MKYESVLFYGNCQVEALMKVLNIQTRETRCVLCFDTNLSQEEFHNIVENADLIITQPINNNYRDKSYLSSDYVLENCKKDCKVIMFNNCHFKFYFFDLFEFKKNDNTLLMDPTYYHYKNLYDCYKNGDTVDYFLENYYNNKNLKTADELDAFAEKSFCELDRRYNSMLEYKCLNQNMEFIDICPYIKEKYKDNILFYALNHPTKYLLQHISHEILVMLDLGSMNTMNYNVDPLDFVKCVMYKCFDKILRFDTSIYYPELNGEINVKKIFESYYDSYKKEGL